MPLQQTTRYTILHKQTCQQLKDNSTANSFLMCVLLFIAVANAWLSGLSCVHLTERGHVHVITVINSTLYTILVSCKYCIRVMDICSIGCTCCRGRRKMHSAATQDDKTCACHMEVRGYSKRHSIFAQPELPAGSGDSLGTWRGLVSPRQSRQHFDSKVVNLHNSCDTAKGL